MKSCTPKGGVSRSAGTTRSPLRTIIGQPGRQPAWQYQLKKPASSLAMERRLRLNCRGVPVVPLVWAATVIFSPVRKSSGRARSASFSR